MHVDQGEGKGQMMQFKWISVRVRQEDGYREVRIFAVGESDG